MAFYNWKLCFLRRQGRIQQLQIIYEKINRLCHLLQHCHIGFHLQLKRNEAKDCSFLFFPLICFFLCLHAWVVISSFCLASFGNVFNVPHPDVLQFIHTRVGSCSSCLALQQVASRHREEAYKAKHLRSLQNVHSPRFVRIRRCPSLPSPSLFLNDFPERLWLRLSWTESATAWNDNRKRCVLL